MASIFVCDRIRSHPPDHLGADSAFNDRGHSRLVSWRWLDFMVRVSTIGYIVCKKNAALENVVTNTCTTFDCAVCIISSNTLSKRGYNFAVFTFWNLVWHCKYIYYAENTSENRRKAPNDCYFHSSNSIKINLHTDSRNYELFWQHRTTVHFARDCLNIYSADISCLG